jgi:two-component system LytT family response regulator
MANPRIRVLVVDDEQPARTRLTDLLARETDVETVGVASDGLEAVTLIRRHAPDLLFLDIQMPGLDGFGVLDAVSPDHMPMTIFVTAYDRYAIQAFEAHAIDYLLKPFSDQRFESAFKLVRRYLGSQGVADLRSRMHDLALEHSGVDQRSGYLSRLVVKSNGAVTFLDVSDIDWIEAAGVYVYLHAGAKSHLYRSSVAQLVQRLDPERFVRIHRSAAVNTSRIAELRPRSHGDYTLVLKNGGELTLSRGYRPQLETWLRQRI